MSQTGEPKSNTVIGSTTTGEPTNKEERTIAYRLGNYQVKVVLGPGNEFIGISEISIPRDFRSYDQKMENVGVHDIDDFYKE